MLRLIVLLLLFTRSLVASAAYTEFYIDGANASASNINGGSSSGAPLITKTNGNWNPSTRVFTFGAGDTLTDDMVGHFACVCNDGTTTGAFFARVTAIDNTTKTAALSSTATIGTAPTTSTTGRTIRIGGCWAGMSGATLFPFTLSSSAANLTDASNNAPRFNFKGSYNTTTQATISFGGTGNKNGPFIEGFSSTPGDGARSTWTYNGSSNNAVATIASLGQYFISSIEFRNVSTALSPTTAFGLYLQTSSTSVALRNCRFTDTVNQGIYSASASKISLDGCAFSNCSNGKTSNGGGQICLTSSAELSAYNCLFRNSTANTGTIVSATNSGVTLTIGDCVFCDNATPCIKAANSVMINIAGSTFYSNSGGCILRDSAASGPLSQLNANRCVFDSNAYVVNLTTLTNNRNPYMRACGFYNNTTKYDSNSANAIEVDCFDFTQSPLVDAENGDYRTRSTEGRNRFDGTITNSSKSLTTRRWLDVGIGPSNPFYRWQQP